MKVSVQIEGVEFRMEVETGAAASILYYTDYERYFKYLCSATQWKYHSPFMLVHRWTFQDRLYVPNNGCNAYLCSLFSCHISSTFYVNIYFSRLFSFLQSFSLGRSDFKSSPEQFLSLEAKAICIAAGVLMD